MNRGFSRSGVAEKQVETQLRACIKLVMDNGATKI